MIYKASLAIGGLILVVLGARSFEEGDYFDPVRQRRHCGDAPSESRTGRTPTARAGAATWRTSIGGCSSTPIRSTGCLARSARRRCIRQRGSAAKISPSCSSPAVLMFTRATNEAATPLHLAAQYGHADVAALLVQSGADVNAVTTRVWTDAVARCRKRAGRNVRPGRPP